MKAGKAAKFSYETFLQGLRFDKRETDQMHVKEVLRFYNGRLPLFTEPYQLFFVIDYAKGGYMFFSENCRQVTGYDAMQMLNEGLEFSMGLMHRDYWKVYNRQIFPTIAETLKKQPAHDHENLSFSFNARLKRANRSWINVLQTSRYITAPATGLPLYCLGSVTDITAFKTDNIMSCKTERINRQTGQFNVLNQQNFYVFDEEKLLTKAEIVVLNYMTEGLSSKMIAEKLKISTNTVANHRKNMSAKTGTNNATSLIAFAKQNGII